MGILDGPLRAVSRQLINQFGIQVTFRLVSNAGDYNVVTRKQETSKADKPIKGVLEQYKARFANAELAGARAADMQLTVAAMDLPDDFTKEEATKHRVLIGSQSLEIIDADPIHSGDEIAVWVLHIRR